MCVHIDVHTHANVYMYICVSACCLSAQQQVHDLFRLHETQELCLQSVDCTAVMVGHGHCWMRRNLVADRCKSSGKMQLYNAINQLKK